MPPSWNGYVEADYVYAAPLSAGQIATLAVHEGDIVKPGDVLFSLNQSQQVALLDSATAAVAVAEANLANLTTGGRQDEIDVIRASLDGADSAFMRVAEAVTVWHRERSARSRRRTPDVVEMMKPRAVTAVWILVGCATLRHRTGKWRLR